MPQSFIKIWIHAVWSTKNRNHYLHHNIEKQVHNFIFNKFKELGLPVSIVNGMPDHVHCLFMLGRETSISKVMKLIKGSSSRFINENNLIDEKFAWQDGYGAFSVSESGVEKVYEYIKNQKMRHRNMNFDNEIKRFRKMYGV